MSESAGLSGKHNQQPLIQLKGIDKLYRTPAGSFTALKGVTVNYYPGEFVSVQGKSGSGKSTLINMITGIDHPTAGTVSVGNVFIHSMKESQMAVWRGRYLGIVFQFFQLLPTLTVLENVLIPMDLGNCYSPDQRGRIALELLDRLGLVNEADQMPGELSGGQQQIAAIARALANDPPVLIADEPTGNLDARTADKVFNIFSEMANKGRTILMVTHDQAIARRTQRQLIISDGELIEENIGQAFGDLPHSELLMLTHSMKRATLLPLEKKAFKEDELVLVTSGTIEWNLDRLNSALKVAELRPGGLILQIKVEADQCLIAGPKGAEFLYLDPKKTDQWINQSASARHFLESLTSKQAQQFASAANHDLKRLPGWEELS